MQNEKYSVRTKAGEAAERLYNRQNHFNYMAQLFLSKTVVLLNIPQRFFSFKVSYKAALLPLLPFLAMLPTLFMGSFSFASQADDEVVRIQKAYEHIRDIRGNFVQKSSIKDLKRTDTYKGQFFIKPPKMKWEYTGDKPQAVYITGEDIIIYQKKEKQVLTSRFDKSTYGQAPLALLSGFGNIRKEFDVTVIGSNRLLLKPKAPMGSIASIEITPSRGEFPIESLVIFDALSNRIEITLRDVRVNTGLSGKVFDFYPPEGAAILRQ